MALNTIGSRIVVEGEKEYRNAMQACKASLNAMKSELSLVTTQYSKNANSLEALKKKQEAYVKVQSEQQKKVELLRTVQEKAVKTLNEEKKKLDEAGKERDELNKKLDEAKKKYGENSDEVKELSAQLDKSNTAYEKQSDSIGKLENKINGWQTELNKAEKELVETNNALQTNEKYIKEAESSYDKTAKSIDNLGKEVKETKQETSDFWSTVGSFATADAIMGAVRSIGNEFVQLGKTVVEVGASFESSMSQVAATMNIATDEIHNNTGSYKKLSDAAKAAGSSTKYSASESAQALNYLALAGYDADKAVETLPKVLNLAAAGGMDLAYASDLVTDSMSALGMETSQLDNFMDQMARTSQKSNTNVSQLGEATLVCAGAVAQVNMPLNDMNTALGVLANNGLKGAEGGTHLRNAILSLTAPTDKASKTLNRLGIKVADSHGNMRDFQDILKDLNASLADMGNVEKSATIKNIFNKTDISAVNALLKSTNGEFDQLKTEIDDCTGAAEQMAKTMSDNLEGKTKELESALEGLGITIYEAMEEPLKKATEVGTKGVQELNKALSDGELGSNLERLGGQLNNSFVDSLEAMDDTIPVLIKGMEMLTSAYAGAVDTFDSLNIDLFEVIMNTIPGIGEITSAVSFFGDTVGFLGDAFGVSNEKLEEFNTIATTSDGIEVVIESTTALGDAASATGDEIEELSEEIMEAYGEMQESVQKSIEGSMSLFDKFTNDSVVPDTATIKENLKSQIDGYRDWGNNFEELANRTDVAVNDKMLSYLASLGIEGAGYVKEFKEMSAKEFEEIQELMVEGLSVPAEVSWQISDSWLETATAIPEAAAEGIEKNSEALTSATNELAENTLVTFEDLMDGPNGSKFNEFGKNMVTDLGAGMKDNEKLVTDSAEDVSEDTYSVIDNILTGVKFVLIGEHISDGLAKGIRNKKSEVEKAATEVANAAEQASRNRLEVRSPSRVFKRIGEYTGEGFIEGFESTTDDIVNTVNSTMDNITNVNVEGIDISNSGQSEILNQIVGLLQQYMPEIGNNQLVLDSGALVGATAPMMNKALGRISAREGSR